MNIWVSWDSDEEFVIGVFCLELIVLIKCVSIMNLRLVSFGLIIIVVFFNWCLVLFGLLVVLGCGFILVFGVVFMVVDILFSCLVDRNVFCKML